MARGKTESPDPSAHRGDELSAGTGHRSPLSSNGRKISKVERSRLHSQVVKVIYEEELLVKAAIGEATDRSRLPCFGLWHQGSLVACRGPSPLGLCSEDHAISVRVQVL